MKAIDSGSARSRIRRRCISGKIMWSCNRKLVTLVWKGGGTVTNMDMTRREYEHVLLRVGR